MGNKWFGNKKTVIDNITFDSKKEAAFYQTLKLRKKAKDIIDFKVKPTHILMKGFTFEGKKIRDITYTPDFVVYHKGLTEFVDVKGVRTDVFNLKWKLFINLYKDQPGYTFTID